MTDLAELRRIAEEMQADPEAATNLSLPIPTVLALLDVVEAAKEHDDARHLLAPVQPDDLCRALSRLESHAD